MRAKPRSQQGPKAFHGVDVYFMKAITVIIPSIFATAVTDARMRIAPLFQATINVVLIRVNTGTRRNCRLDHSNSRSKVCVKYAGPIELWHDALVTTCEDQSRRG